MALDEWVVVEGGKRKGGQGYVQKVQHVLDRRTGAMKRLHGDSARQTERRYRFLTEVGGLRAMAGPGVPQVFESNESLWEDKNAELYVVMEFIDGPTMSDLVQAVPPTLDEALECATRILSILASAHKLSLNHRDLKPDNVMLRNSQWGDPVLVDLGIAWHGSAAERGFNTPIGQELGNRFLRLPEFAPGGEHKDPRSDLAMAGGLLFFMLFGRAPRVLQDHEGRHPHETNLSPIIPGVSGDRRWPRLNHVFRIAFQHRLDHRFRDAHEFAARLAALNEENPMEPDDLDNEIARFRELTESSLARERAEVAPGMAKANIELCQALDQTWQSVGLQRGGQNPVFTNAGAENEFSCLVSQQGHSEPYVLFRHSIELRDGRVLASYVIDQGTPVVLFEGSAADCDVMCEALMLKARNLAGLVIRGLNAKLTPAADLSVFMQ